MPKHCQQKKWVVHGYARDEDKNRERMDEVFEGWIKAGQKVQIRSQTGLITYNYQEKSADRSYGDNHAECKNGNTIRAPSVFPAKVFLGSAQANCLENRRTRLTYCRVSGYGTRPLYLITVPGPAL